MVVNEWKKLGEYLIMKYNDGYVKDEKKHITSPGYPNEWKQEIINRHPDKFEIKRIKNSQ